MPVTKELIDFLKDVDDVNAIIKENAKRHNEERGAIANRLSNSILGRKFRYKRGATDREYTAEVIKILHMSDTILLYCDMIKTNGKKGTSRIIWPHEIEEFI